MAAGLRHIQIESLGSGCPCIGVAPLFAEMLTFRFVLAATAAGVCLWAVFSLLDALSDPGQLRPETGAAIRGCELLDNEETRSVCPQLFCQQAVIETKQVSYKSRFAVTVDKEEGTKRLIGGNVSNKAPTDPSASFICVLENTRIVSVKVTNRAGLEQLAAQSGDWSL
jgi:hypothetical protein